MKMVWLGARGRWEGLSTSRPFALQNLIRGGKQEVHTAALTVSD